MPETSRERLDLEVIKHRYPTISDYGLREYVKGLLAEDRELRAEIQWLQQQLEAPCREFEADFIEAIEQDKASIRGRRIGYTEELKRTAEFREREIRGYQESLQQALSKVNHLEAENAQYKQAAETVGKELDSTVEEVASLSEQLTALRQSRHISPANEDRIRAAVIFGETQLTGRWFVADLRDLLGEIDALRHASY